MAVDQSLETFANSLRGAVLRPADQGYESARRIWNAMIDRSPAVIVRCADPADVVAAVNFARAQQQVVAVHSGGHSAAGSSVCDGGFMIDLSPMKGIRVDPARATVRAEAGLTGAEFDAETQAFGLATTSGVVSTTGIAGLTLGGGIGWLGRTYGLSCDNLLSVDIVTADGQLRTASADENADLFWAVRGGGGNFGVVTSFEYRLHRVGPTVLAGLLVWPRPMALDVLRAFRAFTEGAPENASAYAGLGTSPDGVPIVVGILFHHGRPKKARRCSSRCARSDRPSRTWSNRCRTPPPSRCSTRSTRRAIACTGNRRSCAASTTMCSRRSSPAPPPAPRRCQQR